MAFVLFLILSIHFSKAQQLKTFGFQVNSNRKYVEVPFKLTGQMIVVPVKVNDQLTLNFIVDTGSKYTVILEKILAEPLGMKFLSNIKITAPGILQEINAYAVGGVKMSLHRNVFVENMTIVVLDKNVLRFKEILGVDIHGIIGAELFENHVVRIDYRNQKIRIYRPSKFKPRLKDYAFPLALPQGKPMVKMKIHHNGKSDTQSLLLDTGATHELLLNISDNSIIQIPTKNIITTLGSGLGGLIYGKTGRIDKLEIGDFNIKQPLASFPNKGAYNKLLTKGSNYGTVGNIIMNRFHVTFDYQNQRVFFRKNRNYKKKAPNDKSGMRLVFKEIIGKNQYIIKEIIQGTPADLAGIKVGDIAIKINGKTLENDISLNDIITILRGKEGKNIKMKVRRGYQIIDFQFKLQSYI